jgi:uncharacterized protein YcnI
MKNLFIACLLAGAAACASAHVSLEQGKASAGAPYKAAFRIGHGCDGSATHTVSVTLPAGFRGAKPMPKAGWTLALRKAPLAQPYSSHGRTVTDDVVEVTWKAATREAWLADAHYDEFTLRGQLPDTPQALWFKVQQLCERGELHWADVPAAGTSTRGLKAPAVLLEVTPAEAKGHSH